LAFGSTSGKMYCLPPIGQNFSVQDICVITFKIANHFCGENTLASNRNNVTTTTIFSQKDVHFGVGYLFHFHSLKVINEGNQRTFRPVWPDWAIFKFFIGIKYYLNIIQTFDDVIFLKNGAFSASFSLFLSFQYTVDSKQMFNI